MNTPILVVVGLLVIAGCAFFTRRTNGQPHRAPIVSLVLPLALLFVAAPVPVASLQVIQAFQAFTGEGEAGSRAFATTAAFALTRPFWHGALAGVFVMMLATVIDVTRLRGVGHVTPAPIATSGPGWLAVWSFLLALPIVALAIYVGQIGPLLIDAAGRVTPGDSTPPVDPAHVEAWSTTISNRLIAGVVGGGTLVVLAISVGAVLALTIGRSTVTPRHATIARAATAATTCALAAYAAMLGARLF